MQHETVQRGSTCVVQPTSMLSSQVCSLVRPIPIIPIGYVRIKLPLGAALWPDLIHALVAMSIGSVV
jgi:hypothetical protein